MKRIQVRCVIWALALCGVFGAITGSRAQVLRRLTGQNVQPVFEGWERNADGTFNLVFGYLNRNYEEQPEIPIGPANTIEPGGPDRDQPTYFYPRRQMFAFKVRVPADWGDKRLVWTLTLHGRTDKANGWLNPEYQLTEAVYAANRGGGSESGADDNLPPTAEINGGAQRTIAQGESVSLTLFARDDGRPAPRLSPARPRAATSIPSPNPTYAANTPQAQAIVRPSREGLSVTWIHYRGAGQVTFSPMSQLVKGGNVTTIATFHEPGTHVIRAYADDGVYTTPVDVTVVVKPGAASSEAPR